MNRKYFGAKTFKLNKSKTPVKPKNTSEILREIRNKIKSGKAA
jgi:hypothetical protein